MTPRSARELPPEQYVRAHSVMDAMASFGHERLYTLTPLRVLVLAMLAGGFITVGGYLSVLLGAEVGTSGLQRLVEGFAFSAGFFFVVLSGVLANWLVGMAAFFAMMGRTITGKYIPILLAVTAFVAANFQHSPANMGYFALWMAGTGSGPGWVTALVWNIVPAGLGNIVGATLLVALPFRYVFGNGGGEVEPRGDGLPVTPTP